jgi:Acetyl xylan esterase (AXE1)
MMSTWGKVSKRFKLLVFASLLLGLLLVPAAANATITSIFGSIPCTTQTATATVGQRWCGASSGTTVSSFDGTPIDVAMAFPAESGSDNNYPVVGIYHGWGGTKITPSSAAVQRWVAQGYAVFSISDRGWGASCGSPSKPANSLKAAPCERGYIHLMSRKYEVRDVQTLLGKLADEGLINPQQIGANGGSYGGGMSLQLGSLKDRVELLNGEIVPWTSPEGKPMKIAATAPEYPWSDIAQALQPNGSSLDYVANDPYNGINHEFRYGIEKNNWNASLYGAGQILGYYAPTSAEDPEANIVNWHNFNITGGPYDGQPLAIQQEEFLPYHSAYYTPLNEAPAPALMENGWNDDLFPVDETVRYYNKVRSVYPNQPMKLFYMDLGHNPRSASTVSTSDLAKLQNAQNKWFKYYVKGEGAEPSEAHGGVTAITSFCPQTAGGSGTEYDAPNWASLAPGEVNLSSPAEQTIVSPGTAPANAFTSGTVCTTQASADNPSAAEYKVPAAPASGYTIAGASTVIGEFSTPQATDEVIARLYDVNVSANTEQLIGRQTLRPLNPGGGFTKTVFQLHPQAWNVAAGHVVKLELLSSDSTYARNSNSQHSVAVKNLELRLPTTDAPGSAEGFVQTPLAKYLPSGYTLALDFPSSAPGAPHLSSGVSPNASGQFTLAWEGSSVPTATTTYTLQHQNAAGGWTTVASGITSTEYSFGAGNPEAEGTWTYRVIEVNGGGQSTPSGASEEVKVDKSGPNAPSASADRAPDYAGGGGWYKDSVTVSFSSNGDPLLSDGSAGSGVNEATLSAPQTFNTDGSHTASGTVADNVGNVSAPGTLTVQVDASAPSLEVNCPATTPVGSSASASIVASDAQSGLASDPSGSAPIDTSEEGPQTITRSATDNVGHETTASCTTQVVETRVISGKVKGKLVVKSGEAVKLTSTAQTNAIEVQSGGSLDVEGATTKGIKASKAAVLRICGAHVGSINASGGTGSVTIGDGEGCAANTGSAGVKLTGNTDGVTVIGNSFKGAVKVTGNSGGVTVTGNTIAKSLTVTGNSGTVVDQPNTVAGKTKVQARKR